MSRIANPGKIVLAALLVLILGAIVLFFRANDLTHEISSEQRKVLNRGIIGEPESLNPHQFSSDQAAEVLRDIGEGLLAIGSHGDLRSGVAEAWTVSNDGLVYTFRIRKNARWSNGKRITAHDFVRTYRALVDPKNGTINANSLVMVKNAEGIVNGNYDVDSLGVTARSDQSLEIRLESPTPYFLQRLTHPSLFPMFQESIDRKRELRSATIGNGAYIVHQWEKGSEISLRKNGQYWDAENVYFDAVKYHVVEESSEFNRFRAGELDVTGTVASGIFSVAERDFAKQLKVSPRLGVYYYGFNLDNPKFSKNLHLRRALSMAVDRKLLAEKILARGERPAYGWVPPGTYNYESQVNSELILDKEPRESLAREYYYAAGFNSTKRLKIQLRYNDSDVQQRIALAISAMWREVLGAEIELVGEEFKVLLANIRARDQTEVFRLSWTGDYNDAQTFLDLFESGHPQNLTGYSNSEYDKLIRAARVEVNLETRRLLLESAEALALTDHPVIPIYFYVSKHLVSDRISGWNSNILDIHPSQFLQALP